MGDFESSIRQQQTRIEAYDKRYRSVRLEAEQRTKEVKELKLMTRTLTAERDQMCSKYQMMAMHYASQKQQKDTLLHTVRRLEEKLKRLQMNQLSNMSATQSPASHFAHSANGSMSPASIHSMNGGLSPAFSFSGLNNGGVNPYANLVMSPQKKTEQRTNNTDM